MAKIEIDLTTLQGWNQLDIGTYAITVGATAEGYTRILKSEPVNVYKDTSPAPSVEPYLTFRSVNPFTFEIQNGTQNWDGLLEFSTDKTNWVSTWHGVGFINAVSDGTYYNIYFRGTNNTVITGDGGRAFVLTGTNVEIIGNIETLLDYQTVLNGNHPPMASNCFQSLFYVYEHTAIISAPSLPATTLTTSCYASMFNGCVNLETLPALPATTLASMCYAGMFGNCSKIKISETQVDEYVNEYRIPITGTGTDASMAMFFMFNSTGGTFTSNPSINTTYYTSNQIIE